MRAYKGRSFLLLRLEEGESRVYNRLHMTKPSAILLSLLALCLALSCTPAPQPSPTATPLSTPQPTFPPAGAGTPTPSPMPQATPSPTGGGTIASTPAPPATPTEEPAPSPAPDRTLIPNAPDLDLFDLFRRLGSPWDRPLQPPADRGNISFEKGHRETFWARDSVSKSVYEVEATLSQVSEHAYWYFESGHEPDEEALAGAVRTFEDNIYPVVTSHFGGERGPGIDNDPRITILHVLNIGPLGYYSAGNEFPVAMYPHSNERTMLYMNLHALPVGTSGYLGTLTHELQHVLHWGGDPTDEGWVNEGLSEVAKGLAGYGFSYVGFFLTSPATTLTTWPASGSTFANYGGSTLFMEYLAQRYGGHDSLGELVKRPEDGMEGISAYLESIGYRGELRGRVQGLGGDELPGHLGDRRLRLRWPGRKRQPRQEHHRARQPGGDYASVRRRIHRGAAAGGGRPADLPGTNGDASSFPPTPTAVATAGGVTAETPSTPH